MPHGDEEQARTDAEVELLFRWGKSIDRGKSVADHARGLRTTVEGRRAAVLERFSTGDVPFLLERVIRTRWRIVEIRWDG
ncbi:MAG: hypothetical protein KIT58_15860 [Planctomycetota bacterium]|nr:hypothetical protein [Planctomycetota bacterium]